MIDSEQREASRKFLNRWRGSERGEAQLFWISLLADVLGVQNVTDYIQFEKPVIVNGSKSFSGAGVITYAWQTC